MDDFQKQLAITMGVEASKFIAKKSFASLTKISPYLARDISAHNAWRSVQEARLSELNVTLEKTPPNLKETVSSNEKNSPLSGYTKTLIEYTTTPLQEKVEFLRNSLINGYYGNYSTEYRERLYRLVIELLPLDIAVLQYYCSIYENYDAYFEMSEELFILKRQPYEGSLTEDEKQARIEKIAKKTEQASFKSLCRHFFNANENTLKVSIDNLTARGLLKETNFNTFGNFNPYAFFAPLSISSELVKFISTPEWLE